MAVVKMCGDFILISRPDVLDSIFPRGEIIVLERGTLRQVAMTQGTGSSYYLGSHIWCSQDSSASEDIIVGVAYKKEWVDEKYKLEWQAKKYSVDLYKIMFNDGAVVMLPYQ